jgi:DNA invertase Pin-like site-specific DNA recombinase
MTRACLYGRVSTRDKGQDAENQLRDLRDACTRMGWEVVAEYVDTASGKNGKRPEFQRMFADASTGAWEVCCFWSLDRLSREGVYETLNYLQRLKVSGVQWWSLKEEYLRSMGPFADAVLGIIACVAKFERERLRERVNAGLDRARAAGRIGGRPKLCIDRAQVRARRAAGVPVAAIAREFGASEGWVRSVVKGANV